MLGQSWGGDGGGCPRRATVTPALRLSAAQATELNAAHPLCAFAVISSGCVDLIEAAFYSGV